MSGNLQSKRRSSWSRAGLVLAGAVLAGIRLAPAGAGEVCWIRGDVDGSGGVDLSDVSSILNRLYVANECVSPAGDVNDNGYVTIADPLYILHWQFTGKLLAPAAP